MIMSKPESIPGRNDPCSCGSGRKFKNCCMGKSPDAPAKRSNPMVKVLLIAVPVGILAVFLISSQGRRSGSPADAPQGNATGVTLPATPTPAAWQYDAANNRHWNPEHGHWHDGPPPSPTGLPQESTTRAASSRSATPAAWEYDAANNRHWNPDHGHWHDGPPPQSSPNVGIETRPTPLPPEN